MGLPLSRCAPIVRRVSRQQISCGRTSKAGKAPETTFSTMTRQRHDRLPCAEHYFYRARIIREKIRDRKCCDGFFEQREQ
jgi:hypothetical protein